QRLAPAGLDDDRMGAVAADVREAADLSLAVAHQHDGHTADVPEELLAHFRERAGVGHVVPGTPEDAVVLALEQRLVGVPVGRQGVTAVDQVGQLPARRRGDHASASSMAARVSSSKRMPDAAALSTSCSGRDTPTMAELTSPDRKVHATANWASDTPT